MPKGPKGERPTEVIVERKKAAGERRLSASTTRIEELRGRIREARLKGENTAASEELLKLVENAHAWFVEDLALRS